MEMDGLNSAKCQKSRKWDMMGINRNVNDNKTKLVNSFLPHLSQKTCRRRKCAESCVFEI